MFDLPTCEEISALTYSVFHWIKCSIDEAQSVHSIAQAAGTAAAPSKCQLDTAYGIVTHVVIPCSQPRSIGRRIPSWYCVWIIVDAYGAGCFNVKC
jgi:hypothetical protein